MMNKTKIIVLAGPTASGKTSLAIEIANAVNGEIISADSMQVYKGMSIAAAVPTENERSQAKHRLVEFLEPDVNFSVSDYCRLAGKEIDEVLALGRVPIICGGTGLFIDSLVDNIKFIEVDTDYELRERLLKRSSEELYEELLMVDREAALKIHKNNKSRVARALEIYYSSGKTKTAQNISSRKEESPFEVLYLVLCYKNRDILYSRINKRVDAMVDAGLIEEAEKALCSSSGTAAQAIGHKELKPYFSGEVSIEEALEELKKQTRHYAKRQITWFKRRENAVMLYADELGDGLAEEAVNICRGFLNGR